MPALPGQAGQAGDRVDRVGTEQAQVPVRRMLVVQPRLEHDRIERQDARVIGDHERRALGRHMLKPAHAHPEPVPVERPGYGHQDRGVEVGIEAVVDHFLMGKSGEIKHEKTLSV